ncbi:DnaJ domain-containing protein [Desulfosporosinus metallidurans]|uniref:Chaperone protein DnaJ n=1 Tax=Desulfosporosinus metallidurans TaxID=1888891 RepID=A0A1Q8QJI3_9FIRM|nr:DnaJ domain-containing protein [Desulfosporosinus metallidurans]OLN27513.1 Chaperone protein DnaJ [Desulfosporosinus metallidurans]
MNYYEILRSEFTSTQEELKRAYQQQVKYWHPDTNSSHEAEERLREVIEAYSVLSNPGLRIEYDRYLGLSATDPEPDNSFNDSKAGLDIWYYAIGYTKIGPISEDKMHELYGSSKLTPKTLVWTKGFDKWVQISEVEQFKPNETPPPINPNHVHNSSNVEVKQIRPWVRFWARLVDIYSGNALAGILIGIFIPQVLDQKIVGISFANIIGIPFTILLEGLLLSTWGMTLGKSLFQVFVRDSQGEKLSFLQAIKRSTSAWAWGLGFGVPFASFLLAGMSYQHIKETGVAKWDMDGNSFVSHRKIGIPRIAFIAVFFIGFLWLAYILTEYN